MTTSNTSLQFNGVSTEYALATIQDPNKRFVQYPNTLRLLGNLSGKKVLDIGCGNGIFTRMMAMQGASIVGYDVSEKQIQKAQQVEEAAGLNIKYFITERFESLSEKFDIATAIMVLICAMDEKQLGNIFADASSVLYTNGKFICLTLNPDFKRFGEIICNRRFTKKADDNIDIEFFDDAGKLSFSITDTFFSAAQYEKAALENGFTEIKWEKLEISPEGLKEKGVKFWEGYEDDCPYIGLTLSRV